MRPRPPCPMDDDDDDPPPSPRAKLLCSSGGTVLPRPLDHRLRYVGGETRILRVPRDASLPALLAAARALFPASRALKYLPPGEDFDALVSLVDDEDVAIMMEELDRSPSPSHLRLFADPPAPLPPPLDEREIERRYVDAVNSVADSASAACHFCEFSPSSSSPAPSSPDTVPERGGFPTDIGVVCEQCRMRRRGNSSSPRSRFCSPCRSGPYNLQASSPPHARNVVHEQPVPHARNAVHEQTVPHARNLFHEQTAPFSCAAHSAANSVYLGFDIGTGVYHCRGQLRAPVGPFARPGSNGLAYGMDGACPMPYGSGLVHPWGEQMRGGPGSGLACERASQVLQTNLAVSFTYNQPVQGASFGQSHFGREQQFHAPQMGFVNNLPLRPEGTGFFVPQQVCSPDSFNDGVSLETLRSLSLGSVDFQHGMNLGSSFQGPVRSLIPPALVVVDNPVWAPQTSTQPGDLINEAGFGSEACEHKEHGAAVELQRFGYLYQKKEEDGGMEPKGSVNVTEADSTCQIGIGKYSAPELTNAASLMALEGPVEVNSPSQVVSVSNVPEDVGKEMPAFSYFEIQGVPNDPEVCSNPEQAIAPNIEPTEAEAEAIEKGLQTIKSDDLEEVSALGTGAYGAVFHGKWKGCDVAIKRIKASCFAGKASERERLIAEFWKEALILSSLHHPNVVSFYGIVRDAPDGNLATVTEFMINGSLKKFLQKKDRTIDRRKRLIIAMDVAFGMEYLHEKNIVHFDLKCENLLVNMRDPHRPICKIGDLGLSKVKQRTFVSGGVRGTLPWMAPELLSGKTKSVSEKVDVYSFGIVMWELLTGEEPYPEMSYASVIGGIVNGTLRPQVPAWCDPEWRSLMISCWSAEPTERPSFSEISQQLRKMAQAMNLK